MAVRAKMTVTQNKPQTADPEQRDVVLTAVYTDDPNDPNHSWSKYTPCGQVMMTIGNPMASEQFELGKTFFVDFTPAE
ncbi:MAG: hypothetical protein HY901_15560 [Deltaproteobacteria bacterium]|nr:hypothetical protein [Deltaproteobacteria bacterium]